MAAFHRDPMTPEQEAKILKLLALWSDGEMQLKDITARTRRDYNALRVLIDKHKISKPKQFSY